MVIQIYADGADLASMAALAGRVAGFTTNPSLMRKAGITDYRTFAERALAVASGKPVSFEVLADDMEGMEREARAIASWGENVYVKIPVTNTRGQASAPLVATLARAGIRVNVTAVFTLAQASSAIEALGPHGGIVSVFAGRIADTGQDPGLTVYTARAIAPGSTKILWASVREVYNVLQAEHAGADIITLPQEFIAKLALIGKDLEEYSLETVQQFHNDSQGITL